MYYVMLVNSYSVVGPYLTLDDVAKHHPSLFRKDPPKEKKLLKVVD